MNLKDFYAIIDSEKDLDESMIPDLQSLIRRYPFFQAGMFLYIKCLYVTDSELFSSELQRFSAFIHDRKSLFYYVMDDLFKQFHKQNRNSLSKDRTDLLINAFFETQEDKGFGNQLEETIVNANAISSDYLSVLESLPNITDESGVVKKEIVEDELELAENISNEETVSSKFTIEDVSGPIIADILHKVNISEETSEIEFKHQNLIDSFISKSQDSDSFRIKIEPPSQEDFEEENTIVDQQESEEDLDDDFFFTQTLANIYIKQKKYGRAYEIIKRLSLNYPEKNSYFADQLSFLEKAVKNLKNK